MSQVGELNYLSLEAKRLIRETEGNAPMCYMILFKNCKVMSGEAYLYDVFFYAQKYKKYTMSTFLYDINICWYSYLVIIWSQFPGAWLGKQFKFCSFSFNFFNITLQTQLFSLLWVDCYLYCIAICGWRNWWDDNKQDLLEQDNGLMRVLKAENQAVISADGSYWQVNFSMD